MYAAQVVIQRSIDCAPAPIKATWALSVPRAEEERGSIRQPSYTDNTALQLETMREKQLVAR
jgi:hypothetical protein